MKGDNEGVVADWKYRTGEEDNRQNMGSWNRGKGLWDMGQGTRDTSRVNRGVVVWDLERQKMGRNDG